MKRKSMFTLSLFVVAVLTGIALVAGTAKADPLPGRDLLKFSQLPEDGTLIGDGAGNVVSYFGHDELSTAWGSDFGTGVIDRYEGTFMADDFSDNFNSPVVHVKWWGSYLSNQIVPGQDVTKFLISFEADIPAGTGGVSYSRPGAPLLNQVVTLDADGTLTPGEGTYTESFISPGGPPLSEDLYEYNAELHLDKPFPEQAGEIYWLKIVALVDLPPGVDPINDPVTQWGWHNRDFTVANPLAAPVVPGEFVQGILPDGQPMYHFQDDAVTGDVLIDTTGAGGLIMPDVIQDPSTFQPQQYRNFLDGPGGTGPFPGMAQFSKDLAFELYTVQIPEPTSVMLALMGVAGVAALRRQRQRGRGMIMVVSTLAITGLFAANETAQAATILPGSTTTVTLTSVNGGCTGVAGPDCTHDGDVTGAGGTFVEWTHSGSPGTDIFTYTFNADYNVIGFALWNDRGVIDSGIGNFDLLLRDSSATLLSTFSGVGVLPGTPNSPSPQTFAFGPVSGVRIVDLVVNTSLNPTTGPTQFREVEFRSLPIPEPSGALLMLVGVACSGLVARHRKGGDRP